MGAIRNLAVGTAAAVALVAGLAAPASAEDLHVTGSFTGTGTLASEPSCSFLVLDTNGSGDWAELGPTTFNLHFCNLFDQGGNHYPVVDAHFTITTADGTLTGDFTGFTEAGGFGPEFPLHFQLTVAAGTGRFEGATGQIAMEGAYGFAAATVHGTVDGTVTIPPPTPKTKDDCRHGGWRIHTDEHGRPFRNQGQCICWVNRHT